MNVKREVHIEIDDGYPFGLKVNEHFLGGKLINGIKKGLPFEWEKILMESGFQKNDVLNDITNLVDMMHVYENGIEFCDLPTSNEVESIILFYFCRFSF